MKKICRYAFVLVSLFFVLSCFVGCTREERINVAELERRMAKYDERCGFFDGEVFYCKPTYYTYVSAANDGELLLTVRHDKYGRIDRVTVTCNEPNGDTDVFLTVCGAAAAALLPDGESTDEILRLSGLLDPSLADSAGFSSHEVGKNEIWVFRGRDAVTFSVDAG